MINLVVLSGENQSLEQYNGSRTIKTFREFEIKTQKFHTFQWTQSRTTLLIMYQDTMLPLKKNLLKSNMAPENVNTPQNVV